MKKILLSFFVLILSAGAAHARNCYSSTSGNDANDGLTSLTPYASIGAVNTNCTTSGDFVYLDRGKQWSDATLYTYTGVTYNAYGVGSNPKVRAICNFASQCNEQHDYSVTSIDVALYASRYGLTIRGGYNINITDVNAWANGYGTDSKVFFIDDGASNELTFPHDITIRKCAAYGFLQGAGGRGYNINLIDNVIYNPGNNSAGIESTTLVENYSTTARFPHDWLVEGNRVFCNDPRYDNSTTGQRGINVGWNSYNMTVRRNYIHGCGTAGGVGFGLGVDQNTGILGNNKLYNNIVKFPGSYALYVQTGSTASSDYSQGHTANAKIFNNYFGASVGSVPTVKFLDNITNATTASGIEFGNNIVIAPSATYAAISSTTEMDIASDYNDFYSADGGSVKYTFDGSDYTTLANWRTNSGEDANSLSVNPVIRSDAGLMGSSPLVNAGSPSINTGIDFDGKKCYYRSIGAKCYGTYWGN